MFFDEKALTPLLACVRLPRPRRKYLSPAALCPEVRLPWEIRTQPGASADKCSLPEAGDHSPPTLWPCLPLSL